MTDPWRVHTVVFDLDDTLYPERDFVLSGFRAADKWLQESRNVQGFYEIAAKLFSTGLRGRIFDEVLSRVGVAPNPEIVAKLVEVYRYHKPQLAMYPDAIEILDWVVPRFRIGLVTDGFFKVQTNKIHALKLEQHIACRIISDELGRQYWKPSLRPFQKLMAQLPGPVDGFVYIADNPKKDFIGARALAWRTVQIRRKEGEYSDYKPRPEEAAELEVSSLLELRSIIATP